MSLPQRLLCMRLFCCLALLAACLDVWHAAAASHVARWPQFRGSCGSGVSQEGSLPLYFGAGSNVVWKTALPAGHSSPCIWDDRIFLTGFSEGQLQVLCLDRATGRVLWTRQVQPGKIERGSGLSSPATATPATDGQRVYLYFGSVGLLCFDIDGKEMWRKPLPVPVTQHGPGTSPILAGGKLILNSDQDMNSFLIAVDPKTGETSWRVDRSEFRRGFSTPMAFPPEKPEMIIVAGTLRLAAYQLADGAETWTVRGLPNEMVSTPTAGNGMIFVAGWTPGSGVKVMPQFDALLAQGDRNSDGRLTQAEAPAGPARQHFAYIDANRDGQVDRQEWDYMSGIFSQSKNACLAIRPGGKGDITATHVAWSQTRGLPYVPSPLLYEGRLYLVKNGGLASCFDAATGKVFYQEERLGELHGDNYASPIAAGGRICVVSQRGMAVIYRSAETLDVLARNPLGEEVLATPAIAGNTLYIRTKSSLFAFSDQPGIAK